MIETHVHFNNDTLERDLPGVLSRATEVGVTDFVVVGFDEASSEKAVALAENDARIWAVVGVHPHDAKQWSEKTVERLRSWAGNPRVLAIGEIGLDFYRDLSPRDLQYAAFRAQLALARDVNLPVVIHCRDAYDECLALLETEASDIPLIIHCFAGDMRHAEICWKHGWFIGVDGPVTYKKKRRAPGDRQSDAGRASAPRNRRALSLARALSWQVPQRARPPELHPQYHRGSTGHYARRARCADDGQCPPRLSPTTAERLGESSARLASPEPAPQVAACPDLVGSESQASR